MSAAAATGAACDALLQAQSTGVLIDWPSRTDKHQHNTVIVATLTTGLIVFRGQPRPYPKGEGPALPNFGVPFNLCVHPLTQNYRIWRGNTYGASGVGSKFRKIFDVPLTFLLCPHI